MYFRSFFSALLFLFVAALWLCLNVQAAVNIHSHPPAGGYRAPAKALLELGIATTRILSNGVWIYWNSQTGPDHLIASLKQKFPGGFALEHNDQGAFQVLPPSETGLPKIIIYPAPVQPDPAPPSWLTPSKTLSLVNRETLHTVAQAFHYLATGEASSSVETDPASRLKESHLATTLTLLRRHQSTTSQTPAPTPLGWDDDDEAFLFRQNKPLPDLPSVAKSEINEILKNYPTVLTVQPSPTKAIPNKIPFNQHSNQPKAATVSSTPASPSPSASQAASVQNPSGPASSSGSSSAGTEDTRSLQAMKTEEPPSISADNEEKYVRLPEGEAARDYSQHPSFHRHMEQMAFAEAENIKELVNKYPDNYPMPGMAVTAEHMMDEIARMKTRKNLRHEEMPPLERLEQDVIQLKTAALYPYRHSLGLSYRFLHYKALLDYREQAETHAKSAAVKREYIFAEIDLKRAGICRISYYKDDCSLLQLEQVCWQNILKNDGSFKRALSRLYNCDVLHRNDYSGFLALVSGIPLIPCPHELDISFFNCTAGLPLWLAGFSLAEKTRADGVDMGCSAFFDHDLFHLAIILDRLETCRILDRLEIRKKTDNPDIVLDSIRNLYACKNNINTVSFKAVELVIFYYFHEQGHTNSVNPYSKEFEPKFQDLPPEYQKITKGEVHQAREWLQQLKTVPGDSVSQLLQKVQTNEDNFIPPRRTINDDEVYPVAPEKPAWITSLIESITNRADQIAPYGLNYRHMINLLYKYLKTEPVSENAIDCAGLFSCAKQNQMKEAQWLACYSEFPSSEKTKDFEALIPIIQQHYSEYSRLYSDNLEKLLCACRNTVEDFVAEFIRLFPQISEQHSTSLIKLTYKLETKKSVFYFMMEDESRTYLSFLLLRGNYTDFWKKQDQAPPREPSPVLPYTPLGVLKDGRVHIVIVKGFYNEEAVAKLKKEGYESPLRGLDRE